MTQLARLEFVISHPFLDAALQRLDTAGVGGYTALEVRQGKGLNSGETQLEGAIGTSRNLYVFALCDAEVAKNAAKSLQSLIEKTGGFVTVSRVDALSVKHDSLTPNRAP